MPELDLATLFVVTVLMAAVTGSLLLFAWMCARSFTSLAWWGAGHLLAAADLILVAMRGTVPDFWTIGVGNLVLIGICALEWGATRQFEHHRARPWVIALPLLPWVIAMAIPGFYSQELIAARVGLFSVCATPCVWLAARELWRGRSEKLISRWPVIALLIAHGSWYPARFVIGVWFSPVIGTGPIIGHQWVVMTTFEALVYGLAIAFLALSMCKEREEARYRSAANVDALTGVANRRAFSAAMASVAAGGLRGRAPVALLLFDLDHFKIVNDTHGHLIGDQVLRMFADLAQRNLGSHVMVSRIGGEEFAAILHGIGRVEAFGLAERIRANFEQVGRVVAGLDIGVTVSVGVATRNTRPDDVEAMFDEADAALYLAKYAGRNRVSAIADADPAVSLLHAASGRPRRSVPDSPAAA